MTFRGHVSPQAADTSAVDMGQSPQEQAGSGPGVTLIPKLVCTQEEGGRTSQSEIPSLLH